MTTSELQSDVDVLIVGAGLSGVGAARHLQLRSPDRSFTILEGRAALGGTWDLFRYPGIRSDSDMHTLGYAFRPWTEAKAIADGPSIRAYVEATAREHGILERIRFRKRVERASWSSAAARWIVEAVDLETGALERHACRFLLMCSGYYDYERPHEPAFPDEHLFAGRILHAQRWPEGLDYAGQRVVVIGSGATAVTLVPEMAKTAGHVVMLQRSPSYVVSRPAEDAMANWLRARLPSRLAYSLVRWRNVLFGLFFFRQARTRPAEAKARLISLVRQELGPDYDVETHFTPRYNPWDQRLCLVPDSDLFKAIREKTAEVVTDEIDRFEPGGVVLKSGRRLEADLVVKATGLRLKLAGGVGLSIDGEEIRLRDCLSYKGFMFSSVPNFASVFGYTNASWTLKADLTAEYVCRLLNRMRRARRPIAVPLRRGETGERPWLDFSSGYVVRSMAEFPRQGERPPWRVHQNYLKDVFAIRFGRLADGVMTFLAAGEAAGRVLREDRPPPPAKSDAAPAERLAAE